MTAIFHSMDYRKFLGDLVQERKASQDWFSARYLAGRIGMDHGNFIKVLQGERHLSPRALENLITYLKYNAREAEYFRTLVAFNKSKTPAKTKQNFEKLLSILNQEPAALEPRQYEFYSKWYHTAILHQMDCMDFRGDFSTLASRLTPPITARQAEESVQLLLQLKLLERNSQGRYQQTSTVITTGDQWRSLAIQAFQETTLQLALQSLQRHPRNARDHSTLTMSLNQRDLARVREAVKDFRRTLIQIARDSEPANVVYHLNIQFFPMTHLGRTSK